MNTVQAEHAATVHLGWCARLLSQSKTWYREKFPAHVVVFNANVCTKKHGKIWFGDIDVTMNELKLKALANELDCPVFVLREMDGRFENEVRPLFENAVTQITPTTEN